MRRWPLWKGGLPSHSEDSRVTVSVQLPLSEFSSGCFASSPPPGAFVPRYVTLARLASHHTRDAMGLSRKPTQSVSQPASALALDCPAVGAARHTTPALTLQRVAELLKTYISCCCGWWTPGAVCEEALRPPRLQSAYIKGRVFQSCTSQVGKLIMNE